MKTVLIFIASITVLFALEKNDFAYGKNIHLSQNSGVSKIKINYEIYKSLVHLDLSDIAVFDANGQMMPREISSLTSTQLHLEISEVPFVKFDVLKKSSDEQLRFKYKGALIEMLSQKETKNEDYIIDLRKKSRAIENLYIYSPEKKYMISMNVECSNDLQNWKSIKKNAILANLDFQNSLLKKNSIKLPFISCSFLRIKAEKEFHISKVEVQEYPVKIEASLENKKIIYNKNGNSFEFELTKNIQVENIYFDLKNKEQLYKLSVFAKNSKEKEWKYIASSNIYTIISGNKKLKQHKISLNSKYRYYKIKAQKSSYLPADISMSYQYKRQSLYFMAQGDMPYTLAFGSFKARVNSISLGTRDNASIVEANLGKRFDLGGKNKLFPEKKKTSMTTYAVWLALILGVLLLAFISLTLYKQIQEKD